jgi:hypothetical protein
MYDMVPMYGIRQWGGLGRLGTDTRSCLAECKIPTNHSQMEDIGMTRIFVYPEGGGWRVFALEFHKGETTPHTTVDLGVHGSEEAAFSIRDAYTDGGMQDLLSQLGAIL